MEASVAMTSSDVRASEPRGATVKLDPQRDEGGRQARLPQSFLLSKVGGFSSMIHTPPSDHVVKIETYRSHVVGTKTSSVMMRMATSMMRSPLFSTMELMAFGVDLACVFCVAASLCECQCYKCRHMRRYCCGATFNIYIEG